MQGLHTLVLFEQPLPALMAQAIDAGVQRIVVVCNADYTDPAQLLHVGS